MRRHSDLSKLTIAYCVFGIIMGMAQVAFSADEVCATTFKEVEASNSAALKAGLKIIKEHEFRNKSNGTHLEFLKGEQIMVKSQTTTGFTDNTYKSESGVIKICDKDGVTTIESLLAPGKTEVQFQGDNCFKLTGGLASLAGDRATFCHGTIPDHVAEVLKQSQSVDKRKEVARSRGNVPAEAQLSVQ
ncbi:hypothetical protein BH10BDE1_BH10BDE1_23570 [soil metagenome]